MFLKISLISLENSPATLLKSDSNIFKNNFFDRTPTVTTFESNKLIS